MHLKEVRLRHDRFPTKEHYPFNLELLQKTEGIAFPTPVTFFVGENGSGKSTLLRAIAEKCDIHIWEGAYRTRYNQTPYEKLLYQTLELDWHDAVVPGSFFSSQIFHNFAQLIDEWASIDERTLERYGGASLMNQSHGESLMSYFQSRYKIKGLYLLDEPETALSPKSQLRLLKLLDEMSAAGHAQFIVASHSPILLACHGATIYNFDDIPLKTMAYRDTDYFNVYRDFLNQSAEQLEDPS